jgi:hypothetical protein
MMTLSAAPPVVRQRVDYRLAAFGHPEELARLFAKQALDAWGVGERQRDDVVQIASELVANAVRHACPAPDPLKHPSLQKIESVVMSLIPRGDQELVLEVLDPHLTGKKPKLKPLPKIESIADIDALDFEEVLRQRGLAFVEAFSKSWGWRWLDPLDRSQGKGVWAKFDIAWGVPPHL